MENSPATGDSAAVPGDEVSSPVPIAVAVVEHLGRYLVGARGDDATLPGRSEFPGGKCLPGESPRDAAIRECLEETGLAVVPVELLSETVHAYAHGTVRLAFWKCHPRDSADVRDDHRGFRWVAAAELPTLDFPEANAAVIRSLAPDSPKLEG